MQPYFYDDGYLYITEFSIWNSYWNTMTLLTPLTLETCDLVIDGSCRLSDVDLSPNSNIFTVQARGFGYGGTTKQSHLPHCYELPCYDMVNMRTTLLHGPPTTETMKDGEKVLVGNAVYQGILTSTGLAQFLPRPIEEYYSPPSVMIVCDIEGRCRAILVDPVYTLLASDSLLYNENETLNALRADIRDCMKDKEYSKATEKYRALSVECWRLQEKLTAS